MTLFHTDEQRSVTEMELFNKITIATSNIGNICTKTAIKY